MASFSLQSEDQRRPVKTSKDQQRPAKTLPSVAVQEHPLTWGSIYILSKHHAPSQVSASVKHHMLSHKPGSRKTSCDEIKLERNLKFPLDESMSQ